PSPRSIARGAMDHNLSAELARSPGLSCRSFPVETRLAESRNSTPMTAASCPARCATFVPVDTFQTQAEPSSHAAANSRLSGENEVRQTQRVRQLNRL